jgi:hypothetical protein
MARLLLEGSRHGDGLWRFIMAWILLLERKLNWQGFKFLMGGAWHGAA